MVAVLPAMKTLSFPPSMSIVNAMDACSPRPVPETRLHKRALRHSRDLTANAVQSQRIDREECSPSRHRLLQIRNGRDAGPRARVAKSQRRLPQVRPGRSNELQLDELVQGGQAVDLAGPDTVEDDLHRPAT